MPIKIPESLPARATLESENIFTITEHRAVTQDIRPLRILLWKSIMNRLLHVSVKHWQTQRKVKKQKKSMPNCLLNS